MSLPNSVDLSEVTAPPPAAAPGSLWWTPLLVGIGALLVTALLLGSVLRAIEAQDRLAFDTEVNRTTDAVRQRVDTTITLLHGAAGLFAASEEVRRDEFAAFIAQLDLRRRYPGVQGLGFTERMASDELPRRLTQLRHQLGPTFRVWPQHPRPELHAIVYLEPLDARNQAAIGYDMYTEPTRRAAMERARDQGAPAASGRVVLLQEIDERKQAGFLIYLPVYRGGGVPATLEERRRELLGFVYAPLRVGDLLNGVRGGAGTVDYQVYDGNLPDPALQMISTGPQRDAGLQASRVLNVAGRPWLLTFSSRPAFAALTHRVLLPWLAAVSLAACLLLAWITYVQARARHDAELAAAQRRRNELALRASEERARERAERLQQLYAELSEGDRRKDEFLAVLAHELRNPLAPIRTSLEILKRDPQGPGGQRARAIAERQVRHMVRLVDDLLDVSRVSRGKIVLQREPSALAALVEAAVETSRPLVAAREHHLVVAPVPDVMLDVDPARIAQVLTNLLNNAANYTPHGGRIEIAAEATPHEVRVAVRDNGIGIAPEQLDRVFELFVQVQRPDAEGGSGGLGIGLNLSARLAQLHGGRIEARSPGLGQGAEFVLVLPRLAAAEPQPTGPVAVQARASG